MSGATRFSTAACVAGAIVVACAQAAYAEVKKPVGTTPARAVTAKSNLSREECATAKGNLVDEFACNSGTACEVIDSKGESHRLCISLKQ